MAVDAQTNARQRLLAELREHALVIGHVVLTSGKTSEYLIDAKRAILRPGGFLALSELVASQAREWGATAVQQFSPAVTALASPSSMQR